MMLPCPLEAPASAYGCLCSHACKIGGRCRNPISAEDLLCDYCRDAPLHCHALGTYTDQCAMEGYPA